jgi:hypothetical protein
MLTGGYSAHAVSLQECYDDAVEIVDAQTHFGIEAYHFLLKLKNE